MRYSYPMIAVGVAATLWLLIQAKDILQPLLIALVLWFLIKALARLFTRMGLGAPDAPGPIATALSALSALLGLVVIGAALLTNLSQLQGNLAAYEANLTAKMVAINAAFGTDFSLDLRATLAELDIGSIAFSLAGTAVGAMTTLCIIIVYTIFLFTEASVFPRKLAALNLSAQTAQATRRTIAQIQQMIEVYFGVKCVVGLAQALPTFALLWAIGIDAPGFWAALIFFFSFVPTVGSMVGIAFPALLALLQFPDIEPFFLTLISLAVIQLAGSNWLEPKLTGNSLDLSALVVLLGVFAGAALWGIVGAVIAVPLLSILMMIFAHIDGLRPVAILLSGGQSLPALEQTVVKAQAAAGGEPAGP
ncbi:MAG: AI-2E family transporter [Pseudomonadota bacterium]